MFSFLEMFPKRVLGKESSNQICKYSDSCFQINTPRRVDLIFVLSSSLGV